MTPDRNPDHLFPAFRLKVLAIVSGMNAWCEKHWPGHSCEMAEGFRSTARQAELYAQGRTTPGDVVTQKNGTTNPSNHQSCLAADLVGMTPKGETWDCPKEFWAYLQHLAHVQGLTSGSDWTSFTDQPHLEWPASDKATFEAARAWKKAAGLH